MAEIDVESEVTVAVAVGFSLEITAVGGEAGVEVGEAVVVSLPIDCQMVEAEADVAALRAPALAMSA